MRLNGVQGMSNLKMKAMLLRKTAPIETEPLHLEEVEVPEIGPNELLIKVTACGVCRSNLHMIEGDWVKDLNIPSKLPIIPGHEITGTVVKMGSESTGFSEGQSIGVQNLWSTCNNCENCINGRENICINQQLAGETRDGGYAEYIISDFRHTYHLPDNLDPVSSAPLFCPGVTAYGAVKKISPRKGDSLGIFGLGGVGHIVTQVANYYGAKVYNFASNEYEMKLCERLGLDNVVEVGDNYDTGEKYKNSLDSAIVFTPSEYAVKSSIRNLKLGGKLVLGTHAPIVNFRPFDEIEILGTNLGTRNDMRKVLQIASEGHIRVITTTYPLKEANKVLNMLKQRKIVGRAVLTP